MAIDENAQDCGMSSKAHGRMKLRYACVETKLSIAYEIVSIAQRPNVAPAEGIQLMLQAVKLRIQDMQYRTKECFAASPEFHMQIAGHGSTSARLSLLRQQSLLVGTLQTGPRPAMQCRVSSDHMAGRIATPLVREFNQTSVL